jgi:hypothetical protein
MAETQKGRGFAGSMAKKALKPMVAHAVTVASAYLSRKAAKLVQERLLPRLREKMQEAEGPRKAARETLETVAEKVGGPAEEPLTTLAEKVGGEESGSGSGREAQRRQREQRRSQRRKALNQSGST